MEKKILYVCESMGGGVRRHLVDILDHIQTDRYKVMVVYNADNADDVFKEKIEHYKLKGIECIPLQSFKHEISPLNDYKAVKELVRIIRSLNPDIVHCHSSKAGAIGRLASKWCKVPLILYTPHAYAFQNLGLSGLKRSLYIILERWLGKMTDMTINVSVGERQLALANRIVSEENSIVVYNGITKTNVTLQKASGKTIIGTTMRMDDQKDPWTFYRIVKKIVERYPQVEIVFVGDGQYKSAIEKQIREDGLQERVRLLGFRRDIMELVSSFDIYLITSVYEGLPYSLIEASSLGIPIIATNVTGNNEVVTDGFNGLLFELKNVEDGVNKIEYLLQNPELLVAFGEKGKLLFERLFTIERMLDALELVYAGEKPIHITVESLVNEGSFSLQSV